MFQKPIIKDLDTGLSGIQTNKECVHNSTMRSLICNSLKNLADDFMSLVHKRRGDDSSITHRTFSKSGQAQEMTALVQPGCSNLCNFCCGLGSLEGSASLLRYKNGVSSQLCLA